MANAPIKNMFTGLIQARNDAEDRALLRQEQKENILAKVIKNNLATDTYDSMVAEVNNAAMYGRARANMANEQLTQSQIDTTIKQETLPETIGTVKDAAVISGVNAEKALNDQAINRIVTGSERDFLLANEEKLRVLRENQLNQADVETLYATAQLTNAMGGGGRTGTAPTPMTVPAVDPTAELKAMGTNVHMIDPATRQVIWFDAAGNLQRGQRPPAGSSLFTPTTPATTTRRGYAPTGAK